VVRRPLVAVLVPTLASASALFAALCWLGLSGCDGPDRPPSDGPFKGTEIVFSMSVAEDERDALRELIEQFEQQTGAAVTHTSITAADLPEKLTVDARAGRPTVHLFAQDNLALRVLVDRRLVQPLDDVTIPTAVTPEMVPARFEGERYFLPFRPNVRVTYANDARMRAARATPPRTVEELRLVARQLKDAAGGTPKVVLSLAQGAAATVTIAEWIVSFGGDPLVLNDGGSVRAFEFLQEMWGEGLLVRESLLAKYDTVVDYLVGETAWLAQNWPFTSGVLAEQGLLDRFHVYEGWRGPVRAAHVVGGDVLGMPMGVSGSEREASRALAEFLMSQDAQRRLAQRNAWPSIRADAYSTVAPGQRTTFTAIAAALSSGWYRPAVAHWFAVSDAIDDGVLRVLQRGESVRPVLDELHTRIVAATRRRPTGLR
jgi:trehalose transport system substrate-binding protein